MITEKERQELASELSRARDWKANSIDAAPEEQKRSILRTHGIAKDKTILIAEDSPTQRMKLKFMLENAGYKVIAAKDGKIALEALQTNEPSLVISDIEMPEMSGLELCHAIRSNDAYQNIPIILLTSHKDPQVVLKGLEFGADNFLIKPYDERYLLEKIENMFNNKLVAISAGDSDDTNIIFSGERYSITANKTQILSLFLSLYQTMYQQNSDLEKTRSKLKSLNESLETQVKERTKVLLHEVTVRKQAEDDLKETLNKYKKTMNEAILAISYTIETRDPYTAGHQKRVARLSNEIATRMNLDEKQKELIRMASIVHDIGKISIPIGILNKPGRLSEIEFNLIKAHSQNGYDIIRQVDFPWPIANIVLQHHERLDGSGYPQGLAGNDILPEAKIIAVADVVEAISADRPYRPGLGFKTAIEELKKNSGIYYDPEVVEKCLEIITDKDFDINDEDYN
ncbi:MAG TPA: response regulator [Candidatus Cloacimonadota bacterium]|nr:response regulator [Candidatus Cloacimonadota bacterium]